MENRTKFAGVLLLIVVLGAICFALSRTTLETRSFVGKWKSTKLETPLYLYDNGEWEIKTDNGAILQYGVWRYENNNIIWNFKAGSDIIHDANPILRYKPDEFQIRENDKSVTTFTRLK